MQNSQFKIGEFVYLKTDIEQRKRIVVSICERVTGFTYCLSCGTCESWHYDIEMTTEKDILLSTSN